MTFGTGKSGQLGHGEDKDEKLPRVVEGLGDKTIVDVVCGKGKTVAARHAHAAEAVPHPLASHATFSEHTLVLTSDNRVFGFGFDQYGTVPRGGRREGVGGGQLQRWWSSLPTPVRVVHSGQLGQGASSRYKRSPVPVRALDGKKVVKIAAGGHFSLAVCDDGSVFSWGLGVEGQVR